MTELIREVDFSFQISDAIKSPWPQREFELIRDQLMLGHANYAGNLTLLRDEMEKYGYNFKTLKGKEWKKFKSRTRNMNIKTRDAQDAATRLRDIQFVVDRWPRDVLSYYAYDRFDGQTMSKRLRACARDFPDFWQDFVPVANYVLLHKHRSAFHYNDYDKKIGFQLNRMRSGARSDELEILSKLKSQDTYTWNDIEFSLQAALDFNSSNAIETWTTVNKEYRRIVEGWMGEKSPELSLYLLQKDRHGMLYYSKPSPEQGKLLFEQLMKL